MTNDRWGSDTTCKHGGFFTCQDRYNPGKLQTRKWENAMTIDKLSWGYRRNVDLSAYLTIEELIQVFLEKCDDIQHIGTVAEYHLSVVFIGLFNMGNGES